MAKAEAQNGCGKRDQEFNLVLDEALPKNRSLARKIVDLVAGERYIAKPFIPGAVFSYRRTA